MPTFDKSELFRLPANDLVTKAIKVIWDDRFNMEWPENPTVREAVQNAWTRHDNDLEKVSNDPLAKVSRDFRHAMWEILENYRFGAFNDPPVHTYREVMARLREIMDDAED